VETEGPLDEDIFTATLAEVWNASKTAEEEEPFPKAGRINVRKIDDEDDT
jgi:hypothetical protein